MNLRNLLASTFFIRSSLVISIFLLIFIASVSYKHAVALSEATELLVHSYKIQNKLEQLLSYVKDAETGQRGYIISNDPIFLQPYNSARKNIMGPSSELKSLTSNNIRQYNNLDSLMILINLRFSMLDRSLQLAREPELNKLSLDENLRKGKNVMDRLRNLTNKIINLEISYFEDHEKKYAHEVYFTPLSTLFLILFSLLVFILAFMKINRDVGTLKKTNEDLRLTTESFNHAERIGNFSSWQWHIDTNEFIFSDNQYGLLGVEPQSFEPTIENFLKFVHPDDRVRMREAITALTSERDPENSFFRVIRADGEVRYFISVAKLTNFHEKSIFIGINSDITEQHLSNIALEERNRELERSNAELESFNHVASHDLQEPLRKIQTFVSRIMENEPLTMSQTSLEYFSRIQTSLKRLRALINDLLLFSRTTRAEKKFNKADLNILLDNAKKELLPDIEEKRAIIQHVELPVMNVISFQIQQLFVNIIGNSLKYSKPGLAPLIKIDWSEVDASEYPSLKSNPYNNYYRFSITDDGIGFEQEYAESIFNLFYRLEKTESPGSGIGLAICKKIVENHNGFIFAQSVPGSGSTFYFFLPKIDQA